MGERTSCGSKSLYERRQAGRKRPPVGQKACMRGGKQGERTSCGSKSLHERKQVGRKDLLWNKEYIQEEITIEKEPPMG